MKLYEKYKTLFDYYEINTPLRLAHFMSQIEHESNLKPIKENLNYSASGLLKIFGKYFNKVTANLFARRPKDIANKVYANRMGNGSEESGDGYKYKGRGFLQITGKNNYKALSNDTKIDFFNNPDLLLNEPNAIMGALWFWDKYKLNDLADNDDIERITFRINGGFNGFEHRRKLLKKWKKEIK